MTNLDRNRQRVVNIGDNSLVTARIAPAPQETPMLVNELMFRVLLRKYGFSKIRFYSSLAVESNTVVCLNANVIDIGRQSLLQNIAATGVIDKVSKSLGRDTYITRIMDAIYFPIAKVADFYNRNQSNGRIDILVWQSFFANNPNFIAPPFLIKFLNSLIYSGHTKESRDSGFVRINFTWDTENLGHWLNPATYGGRLENWRAMNFQNITPLGDLAVLREIGVLQAESVNFSLSFGNYSDVHSFANCLVTPDTDGKEGYWTINSDEVSDVDRAFSLIYTPCFSFTGLEDFLNLNELYTCVTRTSSVRWSGQPIYSSVSKQYAPDGTINTNEVLGLDISNPTLRIRDDYSNPVVEPGILKLVPALLFGREFLIPTDFGRYGGGGMGNSGSGYRPNKGNGPNSGRNPRTNGPSQTPASKSSTTLGRKGGPLSVQPEIVPNEFEEIVPVSENTPQVNSYNLNLIEEDYTDIAVAQNQIRQTNSIINSIKRIAGRFGDASLNALARAAADKLLGVNAVVNRVENRYTGLLLNTNFAQRNTLTNTVRIGSA